ncbi:MAG: sugar phosphate isomerase/epimerase [Bacteroidales bacterium]|jgi:sugar phosphate isomerase/epimerase|nr:sugar phosphate isomerase/epimerase [Bacteroidales bacterium]
MTSRRLFIKRSALVLAAVPAMNNDLFAVSGPSKKTGLALYTVRDEMDKDPAATLAAVAAIGFNWVEAANHNNRTFYGLKPKEYGKLVKKNGMEPLSTHSGVRPENEDYMIEDTAEAGMKYLILPSLPADWRNSLSDYQRTADYFNKVGEKCKKAGLTFAFHNHEVEFEEIDGKVPFDILAENTDPKLVTFELDLAWITAAGKDPVAYFKKYPGRFEVWHFKDLSPEKKDATLGEGIIDFKPIVEKAKLAGMKYWFIEQDHCRTHTPMESIEISRNYYLDNILK